MKSARAVAKTMLDAAQQQRLVLTNLTLQKLMYLAHGLLLARTGRPLVEDQPFQAWKYGPVLEGLYHDFKTFGPGPINSQSWVVNQWPRIDDHEAIQAINDVLLQCGRMSGGQLIDFTHAPNGPWSSTYKEGQKGIQMDNGNIQGYFKTIMK